MKSIITLSVTSLPVGVQAISLSELIAFSGEASYDSAGTSVAGVGDVNADGYDDIMVSAPENDTAGSSAGAAYLLYGQETTISGGNLSTAVRFTGEAANDWVGFSVAGAGDVNNDGYDDVVVGALWNDDGGNNAGAAYLLYGQKDPFSSASLTAAVQLTGEAAGDEAGRAVASAGDINNDGFDDILIGASGTDDNGANAGSVYIIYGQAERLSSFSLEQAIQISGEAAGDQAGSAVASAGDVNGDGFDDCLIGALATNLGSSDAGSAYLVYGQASFLIATTLTNAIEFQAESMGDAVGTSLAGGDVNGDGFSDILIGTTGHEENGVNNSGTIFLIYGQKNVLSSQNVSGAIAFYGATADVLGNAISVNDVNNDGYADMVFAGSVSDHTAADAGVIYFVNGQSEQFSNSDLSSSELLFTGEDANDYAGSSVSLNSDINGDGFLDFFTGAYGDDRAGSAAGVLYVGYLYLDNDRDGVAGIGGIFAMGTDCNDDDVTVQEVQTFYQDNDGDGLGNPQATTTACRATPPAGYAVTANDTDDTVKNNGVEIDADGVDNDGDGKTDENNTIGENGPHPEYGGLDPLTEENYESAIQSVHRARRGNVLVTFHDHSVYRYRVFPKFTARTFTFVRKVEGSAHVLVLHPFAKRLAIINPFNGSVLDRQRLGKQTYRHSGIRVRDLLNDDLREVIITAKKKTGEVKLSLVQIQLAEETLLQRLDTVRLMDEAIRPRKTAIEKGIITLRDSANQILYTYVVANDYSLQPE